MEDPTAQVINAIELLSRSLTDPHHWSLKKRKQLKQMIDIGLQVTDELENIEIGPEPADKWKKVTL